MTEAEITEKVTRMEDILGEKANSPTEAIATESKKSKAKYPLVEPIPRGKPKSGRIWKEQKTRFSSIVRTRGTRDSFAKKEKLRQDLKRVKEMSRSIKAEKLAEKEAKKERRRENLKRAEENRKKSEIVQVITNTAKLKRTKRKQLRMIEKRDTLNMKKN